MEKENNYYAHISIERYDQLIEKERILDNLKNDLPSILPNSNSVVIRSTYFEEPYTEETVKELIKYLRKNNII